MNDKLFLLQHYPHESVKDETVCRLTFCNKTIVLTGFIYLILFSRYYSDKKIKQLLRETLLSLSPHMKSFLAKLEHWNIEMAKSKSSTAGSKSKDQKNLRGRSSKIYQEDNRNQRRLPEVQI